MSFPTPADSCPCQCHGQSSFTRVCDIEGGCWHLHQSIPSQTTFGNIGPCVFPGCRDVDDNPRLTTRVVCDGCRRRYQMILHRLAWNYVAIRDALPISRGNPDEKPIKMSVREYGHPAQYASDMARKIADQFNEAHDDLAEFRADEPAPHPGNREPGRVQAGHHYLTSWIDDLCVYSAAADTAQAIVDLDREARRLLGMTSPIRPVYVPCPSCTLLTLIRYVALAGGDQIECQNCGYTVPEEHFGLLARIAMADMIGEVV